MAGLIEDFSLAASDTATYNVIFSMISTFRDDDIYFSALEIAGNAGAPELARAWSLIILTNYYSGIGLSYVGPDFVGYGGGAAGCLLAGSPIVSGSYSGFPATMRADLLGVAESILAGANPTGIKYLAGCLKAATEPLVFDPNDVQDETFTPSTDFSYVKQCGRKFLIRNASNAWVSMTLNLAPSSPPGPNIVKQWTAPPRPEGASYSESTWTAPGAGTAWIKQVPALSPHLMAPTAVDTTPC
jgi:hypothetical protein